MKLTEEIVNKLKNNDFLISKHQNKIKLIDVKIALEENIDALRSGNAQIINNVLQKEKKTFEDIVDIDLEKGEIIFKEVEDAEPERPDNETVPN